MKAATRILTAALVLLGLAAPVRAYNYPDIEWRTIETENFIIHYYEGTAQTATSSSPRCSSANSSTL